MAVDIKISGESLTGVLNQAIHGSASEIAAQPLKKQEQFSIILTDPIADPGKQSGTDYNELLFKSVLHELTSQTENVSRLSFEVDPNLLTYSYVYVPKYNLIPDSVLKKIIIQDDLVAAIIRARETQMSSFGRPRYDRHETGFVIEPLAGVIDKLDQAKKEALSARIRRAVKLFNSCGHEDDLPEKDRLSFCEYLQMSTRNAVGLGRIATEISKDQVGNFHSFRPVDAGTIYRASHQKQAEDKIREEAARRLAELNNKRIEPAKFAAGEYAWIQVIEGMPVQAYTDKELYVCNFYRVVDVESLGYPVTPIDTMFSAISTHINITAHNRIYFQTGRASRGMLVFKSDDINPRTLEAIKQQFNAAINGVGNSWRMPVLGCPTDGEITYSSIDTSGSRDAEFTYLLDNNARVILSAFQMSPDELPGWSYLSKGTNSQALSEGNQEFRIEAGRDQGIRPLLHKFEDFINTHLFPLIDKELSGICRLRLVGLDADTEEKEAIRILQDLPVHGTYDWVLEKVEKPLVGKAMGGDYPLNPQYQAVLDKLFTVGQQKAFFTGDESARNDPTLAFYPNQFWFQWQQMLMQKQQMEQQAQQMEMQAQQQAAQPQQIEGQTPDGQDPAQVEQNNLEGQAPNANQAQDTSPASAPEPPTEDLARAIDQAMYTLTKSEREVPKSKRNLLLQQKLLIEKALKELEKDSEEAIASILKIV